jgi:hypothetical protein
MTAIKHQSRLDPQEMDRNQSTVIVNKYSKRLMKKAKEKDKKNRKTNNKEDK